MVESIQRKVKRRWNESSASEKANANLISARLSRQSRRPSKNVESDQVNENEALAKVERRKEVLYALEELAEELAELRNET